MRCLFFFSSRRRNTRWPRDWSSDVCSSDLIDDHASGAVGATAARSGRAGGAGAGDGGAERGGQAGGEREGGVGHAFCPGRRGRWVGWVGTGWRGEGGRGRRI